jgi:hypothetical protein
MLCRALDVVCRALGGVSRNSLKFALERHKPSALETDVKFGYGGLYPLDTFEVRR